MQAVLSLKRIWALAVGENMRIDEVVNQRR